MKLFLDTANLEQIKEAYSLGIISGVTTNPTIIAKETPSSFHQLLKEIAAIVEGPVNGEVIGLTVDKMIEEGRELARIAPNIIVKIPMTLEGLKAVSVLNKEGISTNVTLIFTVSQALLAARAGATYLSPFIGRLEDIGENGIQVVADIITVLKKHQLSSQVIAASIRTTDHLVQAALSGAHIATIPYSLIQEAIQHPLTDKGIETFLVDWQKATTK